MGDVNQFDETVLTRLHKLGGETLVRRMIDLFLENAPKRVEAARLGDQDGDLEAVRQAVHSLKSTAGNLGAITLQELAGKIEQLARGQQQEATSELMPNLEDAFVQAKRHLEAQRTALPGQASSRSAADSTASMAR